MKKVLFFLVVIAVPVGYMVSKLKMSWADETTIAFTGEKPVKDETLAWMRNHKAGVVRQAGFP